jgi:flagellar protein FlaG
MDVTSKVIVLTPPTEAVPAPERQAQAAAPAPVSDANADANTTRQKNSRREEEATSKMLQMAVESANKQLAGSNRMLQVSVHERTNRLHVRVVCTQTNETIKEIPPEKTLDMFAKMLEAAGILYDAST